MTIQITEDAGRQKVSSDQITQHGLGCTRHAGCRFARQDGLVFLFCLLIPSLLCTLAIRLKTIWIIIASSTDLPCGWPILDYNAIPEEELAVEPPSRAQDLSAGRLVLGHGLTRIQRYQERGWGLGAWHAVLISLSAATWGLMGML